MITWRQHPCAQAAEDSCVLFLEASPESTQSRNCVTQKESAARDNCTFFSREDMTKSAPSTVEPWAQEGKDISSHVGC
jgi:hypothetical protein